MSDEIGNRPGGAPGLGGEGVDRLIEMLARLPGLGPRSARRAALHLLKRRESLMAPLAQTMAEVARTVRPCAECGALATAERCAICADPRRDAGLICVVEDVSDLWAMERSGAYAGRYHVLGGVLSALDGIGPDELRIPDLARRVREGAVREVILALPATMDGQTTAHYIAAQLEGLSAVTSLAQGVPVGGELDYLDDGTITAALRQRRGL
ncbi:recombination mediator RecR [Oceanicella actignis]|uniref:Recombination protein RecR n=1 Tax=Oceanicella actignis TaxID=1189325 RepID=A0A1M7TY66_9RHOB|nr:recombination mediator RecR [Oceanicella actignis]SET81342.1 DNA replication and repair protein RecR [Oceanicella actignis]SHN75625.1 DNA replication and repair protein RecR [Oceanicella actignis]